MGVAVLSSKPYVRRSFEATNADHGHELHFLEPRLDRTTVAPSPGC